ncbi:MAG: hypothetical protein KGJ62_04180 [Armatimonadetes bacterium]|nr:hypothetical protein [Armatimonadota bacterium]MDE2205679.1 hypothetical protein [Armatimonadota bacterium]
MVGVGGAIVVLALGGGLIVGTIVGAVGGATVGVIGWGWGLARTDPDGVTPGGLEEAALKGGILGALRGLPYGSFTARLDPPPVRLPYGIQGPF